MSRKGIKRKRSVVSRANKYGKRGVFGRGAQLDEETYNYFVRTLESYRNGFASDEERDLFANNVLEQTTDEEITYACNQLSSHVIETLLPFATLDIFKRFMNKLGAELRALCTDTFGSHVVDAIVAEAAKRSASWVYTKSDRTNKYNAFVMKVGKFMLNNMEEFIWETYANPTMRTLICSIAHVAKDEAKLSAKPSNLTQTDKMADDAKPPNLKMADIAENYKELIHEFAERLLSWPQFNELHNAELTSGFLQVLLKALAKCDQKMFDIYAERLLNDCFCPTTTGDISYNDNNLPPVFLCTASVRLLEVLISHANDELLMRIYTTCFKGMIYKLSLTHATNFAVQKLINAFKNPDEFAAIVDELNEKFRAVFEAGHAGLIYSLGQTCKRLATKQGSYHQNLLKALDCFEPKERQAKFIICLCKLSPFDQIDHSAAYDGERLNILGTLILQLLISFPKPIHLIEQLLGMERTELKNLLSNPMGCHITDSFASSQFVGKKNRKKLINVLKGTYADLAISRYGSRTFDVLWQMAGMEARIQIMDELVGSDASWPRSEYGRIIANKVHFAEYKRNANKWTTTMENIDDGKEKKCHLLADAAISQ